MKTDPKPVKYKVVRSMMLLFVLLLLISAGVRADVIPAFAEEMRTTITSTEDEIRGCELLTAGAREEAERWFFRRFSLRIRSKTSFQIPGFAKLEIVPEFELLWQREVPEGWATYKRSPSF